MLKNRILLSKSLLKLSLGLLAVIFIISCEGEPGPQGPAGETGPSGPSAETAIIDVKPQNWTGDTNGYSTVLEMPEINQDIFENGAVLVYSLNNEGASSQNFNMLPYTYVDGSSFEYMDFEAYIGKVIVRIKWVDNGVNTTKAPTYNFAFKVVVIKGIKLSLLKKEVVLANYQATMKYLKLN